MTETAVRPRRSRGQLSPAGEAMAAAIADPDPAPETEPNANDVDFGEGAPNAEPALDENQDDADDDDDEPDEPHAGQYQDPREALVDVLRRRLEAVLQPVDDSGIWPGVFVITRKDLSAVLQQPLPSPATSAVAVTASVWTPGSVFVEATCPRCREAVDALVTLRPQLLVGSEAEIKVKAKTAPVPHTCGQTRLKDVGPSRPEQQERLPLSSPVAPPVADPEAVAEPGVDAADPTIEHVDAGFYSEVPEAERDEALNAYLVKAQATDQAALDLGSCPFPSCSLAAEHPGDHSVQPSIDDELDDDLLPF